MVHLNFNTRYYCQLHTFELSVNACQSQNPWKKMRTEQELVQLQEQKQIHCHD